MNPHQLLNDAPSLVIQLLEPLISEPRRQRIAEVISKRTTNIVPIIDGISDSGNVSAVLRSAEAMGYQQVHLIQNAEKYKKANRISRGAHKWLSIEKWPTPLPCIFHLKSLGYRIFSATESEARPITDLDFQSKTAVVFGNEHSGVGKEILEESDERFWVPMEGFTESFNISVAAALSLDHIRRKRGSLHADMTEREKLSLKAMYYWKSVDNAEIVFKGLQKKWASPLGQRGPYTTPWS